MKTFSSRPSCRGNRGLTLIEVVVVITVLLALLAMIAPATTRSRVHSGRMHCINNLQQIARATHAFATANSGQIPTLYDLQTVDGDADTPVNWPVSLLGYLDRADLVTTDYTYANAPSTLALWIQVFTCPEDVNNFRKPGGLSYVANAGYGYFPPNDAANPTGMLDGTRANAAAHTGMNLNWGNFGIGTPKAQDISYDSGVFQIPDQTSSGMRMTLDRISNRDGLGQTLMFSENLHAHNWGVSTAPATAVVLSHPAAHNLRFSVLETAFVMNGKPGDIAGMAGAQLTLLAAAASTKETALASRAAVNSPEANPTAKLTYCKINALKTRGTALKSPVPSSNHPGVVNVIYCDGHGGALAEGIDESIYVRLITSGGVSRGQAPMVDPGY